MEKAVIKWQVVAIVATVLATAACLPAAEMTSLAKSSETISLDLKDVDVRSAIEAVFRNTGKNFALDPNVAGTIPSVSFRDVPFETALKSLTKTAGLVFRMDQNIYLISKKPEVASAPESVGPPSGSPEVESPTSSPDVVIDKVPLNYSSPSEILAVMGGGGREYGGFGGGYGGYGGYGGGMGGYGGGYGGMGGYGGGMMGGVGNLGFGGMGGGYGGGSSYGGYGSSGSSYGGYGGYGGNYGSGYGSNSGSSGYSRRW
ncbi:MAG: secretin and TonB N-terminal domain-containing protein [Armatimonadota bacterium]